MKIIAEIGWNFLGDLSLAKEMSKKALESGATIAKFQYWNPDTLKPGAWDKDGRREIYKKAALNRDKIQELIDYCDSISINSLFSVFTLNEARVLRDLGLMAVKIPSHEIANYELIEYCASNFSTIYLSTGASSEDEVIKSNEILSNSEANYNLMHCVSSYPCNLENANLPRIEWLKSLHKNVGLSDHTQSTLVPALSVALGAEVIEKHFTTDNNLEGRDNKFALNAFDFKEMVDNINNAILAMDYHGNNFQDSEADTVKNYRGRWG
jgi:sialic acid synthase SpsE